MKRIAIWAVRTFAAVVAAVAILLLAGLYQLLSTDELQAKSHVQVVFTEECGSLGVVAAEYEGPFLKQKTFWSYEFYWINKKTRGLHWD
jgi:hypothetical protein